MAPPAAATTSSARPVAAASTVSPSLNPDALLDSLDAYTSSRATAAAAAAAAAKVGTSSGTSTATPPSTSSLDPIDFLNRHYANETMLVTQLPSLRTAVSERMELLDDRISNALQRQSETADSTRRHVQEAKTSVASLEKRIRLVQAKASQSERAVLEITKEMKRLDCAKKNLQRTITTLKRLHMLVHAVEQLRLACLQKPFPDYKAASHLVDAIRLLLKHFDAYTHKVEPMRLMGQKVTDLQMELRKGIVRGFRIVGFGLVKAPELEEGITSTKPPSVSDNSNPDMPSSLLPQQSLHSDSEEQQEESVPIMPPQVLSDATLLLDALGSDTRNKFVFDFCDDHLGPYSSLFAPAITKPKTIKANSFKISDSTSETSSHEKPAHCLDQMERRFAWFRRVLRDVEEKFPKVFPPYWNMQYTITCHFLEDTGAHILALLDGPNKDKDSGNATILLKALQKTILFEKEMTVWLQRDHGTVFLTPSAYAEGASPDGDAVEFDESGRMRYEKQKSDMKTSDSVSSALDEGRASAEQVLVRPLMGLASSAFDDYMTPYIALEEQSMDEQLVESTADTAVDTRGDLPVFTSSTALFVYIKGSITRCTALTKGKAFFLLFQAFQDSLGKYATVLSGKLPNAVATGGISIAGVSSSFAKQEGSSGANSSYRIPEGGEVTVCHVISTCEYCVDTVEALEDLIRDTIETEYKSKIDMSGQQEKFHDVTAKSIRVLVSGLENRIDGAFKMMTGINWATFDMVGEESTYVRSMHSEIQPFVVAIRGILPSSYFRSFCDKFATAFTSAYYDNLIKLKRISEPGTQQLLLDVYNLKTLLLKLPVMEAQSSSSSNKKSASAGSTIAPAMYTKMVSKQFKNIETLLKLVGTPHELLIDVFRVQWVGGSALDLQTVMTLKGMKRGEQAAMLEKLGLDRDTALKGATAGVSGTDIMTERVQALQDKSSDVAARVNSDLFQMRQKVDDFRKSFR